MAFEIHLRKPTGEEGACNRQWADAVAQLPMFTVLEQTPEAIAELANDVAADVGLTPEEYIRREVGVTVAYDVDELWINVGFWSSVATVELPNFPPCGIEAALLKVAPVLRTLQRLGFVVLNPQTDEALQHEDVAALAQAYAARQALVQRVAELNQGSPG